MTSPSPTPSTPVEIPPGPDCDGLDAFAATLPDDGHRDIAVQAATAVRALCGQLEALTAIMSATQEQVDALQAAVTALQPAPDPTPDPTPVPDPAPDPATT